MSRIEDFGNFLKKLIIYPNQKTPPPCCKGLHTRRNSSSILLTTLGLADETEDLCIQYKIHTIAQVHVQISEGVCGEYVMQIYV